MILALFAVVQIGSKAFTESTLLAEVAAQLARSAGVETNHRRELGGSRILWEALPPEKIAEVPLLARLARERDARPSRP